MKVKKFWNQAFLAALARLPAEKAKEEADLATDLCIKQWQGHRYHWAPAFTTRWQDQSVFKIPEEREGLSPAAERSSK